jgi:hypothetical protein
LTLTVAAGQTLYSGTDVDFTFNVGNPASGSALAPRISAIVSSTVSCPTVIVGDMILGAGDAAPLRLQMVRYKGFTSMTISQSRTFPDYNELS